MKQARRYGTWPGNSNGTPEDKTRCIVEVRPIIGWVSYQCSRKRGHGPDGLLCKQHAKRATIRRVAEGD